MSSFKYKATSEQLKQGCYDFDIDKEYHYINIGDTTVSQLQKSGIFPSDKKIERFNQNKPDGIILSGKNNIRVLIEYKMDGKFSSRENAITLLKDWYFDLAEKLGNVVVCISDGSNTYWFNSKKLSIKTENGDEIKLVLNTYNITSNNISIEEKQEISDLLNRLKNIDEFGRIREIPILNPKKLAERVWQKIWITTGKEPEKCLYNVVEIFIFKFLSDLNILNGNMSFNNLYIEAKKNSNYALDFYANIIRKKIKEMFPQSIEDNTTIINGTIFVNEKGEANKTQSTLFKNVLEEFKKYDSEFGSFKNIDKQFKTRLYESFLRESAGVSAMGQYFTPRNVVIAIIKMITEINFHSDSKIKICDPFCGVGGFLLELLNEKNELKRQFEPKNGEIKPEVEIVGFDKGSDEKDDERTIILAKANMLIYFSDIIFRYNNPQIMKELSKNVFNKVFRLVKNNLGTFSINKYENYFDLIITNPPYVTSGVKAIKEEIKYKGLEYLYPSNGNGLEGLAIEWIINALKPSGKAFIILPDGILNRQGDKKLRDKILDTCIIDAIISMPTRTFFATPKKTYILAITKKELNNKIRQTDPFFTFLISEIGETRDAKRFEIETNDLNDMVIEFLKFMAIRNKYISDNKRCKIQNIDILENGQHWLIDKYWSDKEKIELGIEESISEMNEEEFSNILFEIGNEILLFSKELKNENY